MGFSIMQLLSFGTLKHFETVIHLILLRYLRGTSSQDETATISHPLIRFSCGFLKFIDTFVLKKKLCCRFSIRLNFFAFRLIFISLFLIVPWWDHTFLFQTCFFVKISFYFCTISINEKMRKVDESFSGSIALPAWSKKLKLVGTYCSHTMSSEKKI